MSRYPIDGHVRVRVVYNDLPKIAANLEPLAAAAVERAAYAIEGFAKAAAPIDTGNLVNSIQATQLARLRWLVTVGADYGIFVEFGTVFVPAQPFLLPAADEVRAGYLAEMRAVAGKAAR